MFGNSPVPDIRRAAQAHERAAKNASVAIVDAQESLARIETAVYILLGVVIGAVVADAWFGSRG